MANSNKTMKGVSCINRKGVDYWYARIDGYKKYCGKGEKGREMAIAAKAKAIAQKYEDREITAGLRVKRFELKTIKEACNWYMTMPSVQEKKGYPRNVNAVSHLLEYFRNKSISGADPDEQERYRKHREGQGAADATINSEIGTLRAVYNMALKRKKIPHAVMPGEFIQKGGSLPRRIVTEKEFENLLEHSNPDFQDLLTCAYETAMRSSEISNLTAGQVQLDMKHISGAILDYIDLGIFDTKTGARRTVPVSQRLKAVLKKRIEGLDPDDFVFKNAKGRKYYVQIINGRLKKACGKAKIHYGDKIKNKKGERIGIVFHCFRHTRTTKWVEMGYSDEIIRRATGHKSLEAYQNYVKLDPSAVMRLVEDKPLKTDNSGIKLAGNLTG